MRLLVFQIIKGGPDLLIYEVYLLELPVGYDIIVSDKMAHTLRMTLILINIGRIFL